MPTTFRLRSLFLPALALAALTGCEDGSPTATAFPNEDSLPDAFTRSTTLGKLQGRAATGPIRVEIDVRAGGPPWVAREVEVENDADDEEKIESRIVSADRGAGTVRLLFGDLVVDVSSALRFRAEGSGDLTRGAFFDRVETALAGGRTPGVELRRRLPSTPQAPDDPTFSARDVRLDDDADVGKLELLIDDRHVAADSETRGRLTVLGVEVTVDPSLGSEVGERDPSGDGAVEIEGLVDTVDPSSGAVALVGGPVVRIVAGTRFDDGDHRLTSLQAVADALAAGHWVEMEAEAVSLADGSWIAVEVEFEVEDDVDDGLPGAVEFEGDVAAVDLGAGTFTLVGGAPLPIDERTRIDADGDLSTLAQVADALGRGVTVEAEGHVIADAAGGTRVLTVKFETDDDDDDDGSGGD